MSADVTTLIISLLTDPVFGLPLTLWVVAGIAWLIWGNGVHPPALLPYRANRVRSTDPVSAMYWALKEQRYSEAIIFAYQRLSTSFFRRYGVTITEIPWRPSKRRQLGLQEPRPYHQIVRKMVRALDVANTLEKAPTIASWAALRRPARQVKLDQRMAEVFADLDWMLPMLEARR